MEAEQENAPMRRIIVFIAILAAIGPCVTLFAQAPSEGMQKAKTFPHAGVKIAVPKTFEYRVPTGRFSVIRAVKSSGNKVVLGVTLSAFPQGEKKVTADEIADAMTAEMGKSLAIRNLKLVRKLPMTVCDIKGTARLLSYTFRGKKTTAARVFFIRELKNESERICYVLTVEAAEGRKTDQVRTLGNVIKSMKLVPVQHPRELKIESYQPVWTHYKLDFSVQPPKGWFAVETPTGVALGQVDYLAKPVPSPSPAVAVVAVEMEKGTTCADLARKTRLHYQAEAASADRKCTPVASGKAKLSGVEGTQLAMWIGPKDEKTPTTQPADGASYEVVILRVICVPHPTKDDAVRAYSLVYNATNQPPDDAAATLQHVAEKFRLTGKSAPAEPSEDSENKTGSESAEPEKTDASTGE